jgi:hypothetical protein
MAEYTAGNICSSCMRGTGKGARVRAWRVRGHLTICSNDTSKECCLTILSSIAAAFVSMMVVVLDWSAIMCICGGN